MTSPTRACPPQACSPSLPCKPDPCKPDREELARRRTDAQRFILEGGVWGPEGLAGHEQRLETLEKLRLEHAAEQAAQPRL